MMADGTLVKIFHGFPHVDLNFKNTTSIFTPTDSSYQQALSFNGIYLIFAALIFSTILVAYFLVCSCYFCTKCQTLKPRPTRSRCLRLLIAFLAFLSCGPMGIGFYANNETKAGVNNLTDSALNIYNTFDLYKFKNAVIIRNIEVGIERQIVEIGEEFSQTFYNLTLPVGSLNMSVSAFLSEVRTSNNLLKDASVDLKSFSQEAKVYELIRWWITLGIYCWHILLVMIIFYSAYTQRRCPFVVLTVMTLMCSLFMTLSVAFQVPYSIAAADLCSHPNAAILQYIRDEPARELVEYYLECSNSSSQIQENYELANKLLQNAEENFKLFSTNPLLRQLPGVKGHLHTMEQALSNCRDDTQQLIKILNCKHIHNEFGNALRAVCVTLLDGLGLLTLSALIITLLLFGVLLCITPIWKAIAPLKPILKREKPHGVHLVTNSYEGPPGGSESFPEDSSFEASYKSIEDREEFEHVPLFSQHKQRPPSYRAIHGSTEFLSVEEDVDTAKLIHQSNPL